MVLALAFIPLLIKIACLVTIFALGMETQYLRQGLIALPSYFAEGVLFARLIVMAGKNGETLGPIPSSDDRRIMAASLLYVLIKLILAFVGGMGMAFVMAQEGKTPDPEGSLSMFFAGIFVLGMMLWSFRLVWLYIPLAQGYAIMPLLQKMKGLQTSLVLLGTWLICFIPLALLLVISAGLIGNIVGHTEDAPSALYRFLIIIIQGGLDIVAGLVATLAISFGFHTIMATKKERT